MGLRLFKSCALGLTLLSALCLQTGCSFLAVADAAVSVGAAVVKTGVNVVGAAVDAVLPSKDKK